MRYHGWVRIVCPSCAATYDVPEAALAPGRPVRCARCGTEWAPLPATETRAPRDSPPLVPPSLIPSSLDPPDPTVWRAPERVSRPAVPLANPDAGADADLTRKLPRNPRVLTAQSAPGAAVRRPRRSDTAPLIAWLASLVLLIALIAAAYAWRGSIMAAWPPSERLYAALGLARVPSGGSH